VSEHYRPEDRGREETFVCVQCGRPVSTQAFGTRHRNHCPWCLWSRHVDERQGDRRSACRNPMEPVAVAVQPDGEWAVVHQCRACGVVRLNRIAGDDNEVVLTALAVRALAYPPFPLDRLPLMYAASQVVSGR
jgi:hypothetical protein